MRPSLPNASSAPCDIEKGAVLGGEKKFVGEVQGAPVTLPVFFFLDRFDRKYLENLKPTIFLLGVSSWMTPKSLP